MFWCNDGKTGDQTKDQCIAARGAILDTCTGCHAITPIVKSQKTPDEWRIMLANHRARVPDVDDKQMKEIQDFLAAHYNPKNPVPKLPPELDKLGTPPA